MVQTKRRRPPLFTGPLVLAAVLATCLAVWLATSSSSDNQTPSTPRECLWS
jgi:hypothetical protein